MNGKKAKALRRVIYGEEFSPRLREYERTPAGTIRNVGLRREYQRVKRAL